MATFHDAAVETWFARHTVTNPSFGPEELRRTKADAGLTIGVCLPALDEAATIGPICEVITSELVADGVVDELMVIDSGSTDRTVEIASECGATVHRAHDLIPEVPVLDDPGKGESLWKSLAVLHTDIVVWLDSDTRNFGSHFVTRLVAPMLRDPDVVFTKAFYERPLHADDGPARPGGGRVTEVAIRPLVNLLYPALAGFVQPLSGEYAGRRSALIEMPFGTGYDVDLLLLIDLVERYGLDRIIQVDLGTRVHRNRPAEELGRMSFEIFRSLLERLEDGGRLKLADPLPETLTQFTADEGTYAPLMSRRVSQRRPPMRTLIVR